MITSDGVAVPDDMAQALEHVPGALAAFTGLRGPRQLEYVEWVGRTRDAAAREQRLAELPDHVLADAAGSNG